MTKMYHYATVSKALDQLNEKGFTFDFNLNSDIIKKILKNLKLFMCTDTKGIRTQAMRQLYTELSRVQVKKEFMFRVFRKIQTNKLQNFYSL
jgi:hypothetical protein